MPFVEPHCVATIASVGWSIADPSVASVTPEEPAYRGSWLRGLSPGPGTVEVSLQFSDGSGQQAVRAFIVAAAAAPSGAVAAEGDIFLDPSSDRSRYVPFELPQDASRIDISVDWALVFNTVGFVLYRGSCSGTSFCGGLEYVPLPSVRDVKPVRNSATNLSAGPYTLLISNSGPGAETVRYEVRFTPR